MSDLRFTAACALLTDVFLASFYTYFTHILCGQIQIYIYNTRPCSANVNALNTEVLCIVLMLGWKSVYLLLQSYTKDRTLNPFHYPSY